MPLREAKSIDALAAETSDADLTLSADPPLTLALDRRVTAPRLGRASATPRSYAADEFVPRDRRSLFETLVGSTDLTWKRAHRALDRCLDCWDATGSLEAITDYEEFDTPAVRTTRDVLREADSSYRDLAAATPPSGATAVVDEARLSSLDRTLLPDDYRTVSPFTGETAELPSFHVFPSATAIVDALVTQLDARAAEAVGIVLDDSSVFSPLVESALETAGVPYQGGPGFVDDDDLRAFLRLSEAVFAGGDLRVSDLRPLVARLGIDLDREDDHRRVDRVAVGTAYDRFREAVRTGTLREAIAVYEEASAGSLDPLRRECDALGLLDGTFTRRRLDQLRYYVGSFDVPVDRDDDGVLLADGAVASYIDRPVVFYLGLGDGWARTPPDLPWVDPGERVQRDLDRFEILLQNGRERHALVQETHAGSAVTPCVYLRDAVDDTVETFTDLPHATHGDDATRDGVGTPFVAPDASASATVGGGYRDRDSDRHRDRDDNRDGDPDRDDNRDGDPDRDDTDGDYSDRNADSDDGDRTAPATVSQSTLRRLANCPREEYFRRLVDSPTSLPMARGTVVHEAAELYVADPDAVRERREAVIDAMCEQVRAYASTVREPVERTRLDLALETVTRYLDAHPPEETSHDAYADRSQSNELAERLGMSADSALTERWFEAPEVGLHGFVDLLHSGTAVVDYKTGSQSTAASLRRRGALDPPHEDPTFQAAAYLAQQRRERPNRPLEIRFVHVLEQADRLARGDDVSVDDCVTTVEYLPCTFGEFAARRETYEAVTDYADSNDRVKALEPLGYEAYRDFFTEHDLPRKGVDPDRRADVTRAFIEYTKARYKDTKYVENGCRKAIGDVDDLVGERYLTDDLDAFESFVARQRDRLADYRRDGFPVRVREDGPNWDRVDARDLVIDDV
ncbi:PD-(D/E)XK nuclease family protein [Halobaculum sp. CBA1158]|uniref:PD-(D/E)XK nuclease family protein n=1 Tax=Halobaculum sp. CBA1158 TaxID=2904243 RepID=UPI001F193231|nr:PD-(D/E)XK nuclease family protein [Halobaculum sp. CBA1158]UIO99778.1 PD-(D/E)XK nuclease family protein [Halobaculum sp. CBA1158]